MRQFLLDTSAVLHLARTKSPVADQIEADYRLSTSPFRPSVCVITIGEMKAFAQSWGDMRVAYAESVLARLSIVDINHVEVIDAYGVLHSENRALGLNLGQNDLWIAATALATGLTLLSADGDFLRLVTAPDLIVVNAKTGITEHKSF